MPNTTDEHYNENGFSVEEIREAKLHDIESYFEEYFKPKVDRLRQLYAAGDKDEAFLLAYC